MKYIHFSSGPLKQVHSVVNDMSGELAWTKPEGLWISVDQSWKEFAQKEGLGSFDYATEVILSESANILIINSVQDLDSFTIQYGTKLDNIIDCIDWQRVASHYDGIIIGTYLWERRITYLWYYGWNCASGCIWNADAVAQLRPIEEVN